MANPFPYVHRFRILWIRIYLFVRSSTVTLAMHYFTKFIFVNRLLANY